MKKVSPLNYAFAVGKIRVLERFLIRSEVFQEAIDSDVLDALKLFTESGLYNDELMRTKDSQQLESLLSRESLGLKELIRGLLLDKNLGVLLDWADLSAMQEAVRPYESRFLNDYLSYAIDLHNIKSFLRLYILREPEEKLKTALICAGFIPKETLLKLYNQDLAVFLNQLEYVHNGSQIINYAYYLADAVRKLEKEKSFASLEKAINDFLIQMLRQAKYLSFGPEPLIAYYLGKRNEIDLVRTVILSKLNNIPDDLIRERINAVYA